MSKNLHICIISKDKLDVNGIGRSGGGRKRKRSRGERNDEKKKRIAESE